jgi:hypothetical protein
VFLISKDLQFPASNALSKDSGLNEQSIFRSGIWDYSGNGSIASGGRNSDDINYFKGVFPDS